VRIIKAWQRISPEVIVKGFKKCCISNAVDETDNNVLWNDSEEDGNVSSWRKKKALTLTMEMASLF
jgi:hypothetical protein